LVLVSLRSGAVVLLVIIFDNPRDPTVSLAFSIPAVARLIPCACDARGHSAVFFAFLIFWETRNVNLFAQSGGNCAQVVRRGCFGTDSGPIGLASRAHSDGEGKPQVHAIS